MAFRHRHARKEKNEDRARELKEFIARFSANASKSRQATARKKMLGQLDVEAIAPSSRKSPHIVFDGERVHSKRVLTLTDVSKEVGGHRMFEDVTLTIANGERVGVVSRNSVATSTFLDVVAGVQEPDTGRVRWGESVRRSYLPKDYGHLFEVDLTALTGCGSLAKISTKTLCGSFWAGCCSPAKSRGSRSGYSPVGRGYAA